MAYETPTPTPTPVSIVFFLTIQTQRLVQSNRLAYSVGVPGFCVRCYIL